MPPFNPTIIKTMPKQSLEQIAVNALEDLKATDITVLNLTGLTSIADVMIIASARSSRQMKALADNVVIQVKAHGGTVNHEEGTPDSGWMLIDLYDVIVHVMLPETREFYQLEKLWVNVDKK